MPDKLLKDGFRTSAKIGGVSEFAELLFVRLLLATCHLGRCPWNPDWIRTHALSNRPRKRLTEIAAALETLRHAHLVARYTAPDGTAYLLIPNHGQRLKHAVRSPWPAPPVGLPDTEGQIIMAIGAGLPPDLPAPVPRLGKKPKATGGGAPPPLFSSSSSGKPETETEWLARLRRDWPLVDIAAELREAGRKKPRGVERLWFEEHWLPRCSAKVGTVTAGGEVVIEAEPEAWRLHLKDHYEGESWAESAAALTWAGLPAHWRTKIATEMGRGRAVA